MYKETALLFLVQIANQFLPITVLPHIAEVLGLERYGVYAYGLLIVGFGCLFVDFGYNLYLTPLIAKNKNNKKYIDKLLGEVLGAKILLIVLFLTIIFILMVFIGNKKYYSYRIEILLNIIGLIGLSFQPIWFFGGMEKNIYAAVSTIGPRLTFVLMVYVFVLTESDLYLLIIINGLSSIVALLIMFGFIWKLGYWPAMPKLNDVACSLKNASPFFWSRIFSAIYSVGGGLCLGIYSGPTQVAIYATSEQLYKGCQGLLAPIGQVLYPYMVRTKNYRFLWRVLGVIAVLHILATCIILQFSDEIINLIFGKEFLEAKKTFNIFMIALVFNMASIIVGYPLFGAIGKLNIANSSVIIAGIVQIFLISGLIFLEKFSAVSVALTVLFIEVIVFTARFSIGIIKLKNA